MISSSASFTTPIVQNAKKVVISIDFGTSRTGYCYSFTSDKTKTRVKNMVWPKSNVPYPKTLTQLLYDKRNLKKPIAWGYEPLHLIATEHDDDDDAALDKESKYFHFRNFKMGLFNNDSKMVKDSSGQVEKKVGELIVDYLKLLYFDEIKPKIEKILKKTLAISDITWCLTVPAIWKDEHKADMRLAAFEAGLISSTEPSLDDFKIVLEPEGAAAYCMEFQIMKGDALKEGDTFLVCDLGGGTVDLTCHKYEKGRLKELCEGTGDACGSTKLDEKFAQYLEICFGTEFISKFKKNYAQTFLAVMDEWERTKVSTKTLSGNITMTLPGSFSSIVAEEDARSDKFSERKGTLKINSVDLSWIYKDCMEKTRNLIKNQLENAKISSGRNIDYIFVVGGFGSSEVIQNDIKLNFGSICKQVIIPNSPSEAVVDGAALLGIDDSLISTRRMRMTYGLKVSKKTSRAIEEVFDTFVSCGEEVEVNRGVKREYKAQRANQTAMKIVIYCTKLKSMKVVDDTKCKKVGEIIVDMKDTTGGLNRVVQVTMYFGKAETTVEAIEKNSGKIYNAVIKYEGELFKHETAEVTEYVETKPMHIIFANDMSGSMSYEDVTPTKRFLRDTHYNRLGALYESCYEFISAREGDSSDVCSCILHHHDSITIFEKKKLSTKLVTEHMMQYSANGDNDFKKVFQEVGRILSRTEKEAYKPVVLFMTDGVWHDDGAADVLTELMIRYPDLTVHVIALGPEIKKELMQRFATIGNGTFTISKIELGSAGLTKTYLSLLPLLD